MVINQISLIDVLRKRIVNHSCENQPCSICLTLRLLLAEAETAKKEVAAKVTMPCPYDINVIL